MLRTGMSLDACVHHRLRIARFVALVMAKTPEPDKVEHHIGVELVPVFQSDLDHTVSGLRIVSIDMENRCLRYLRGVSRIDRAACILDTGGKADLVVDDDVDRSARAIPRQAGKLE